MKRWARRSLFSLGLLLTAAALLLAIAASLYRATPSWYAPVQHPPAQQQQLARAAENKLIDAQNWAAALRADAVRNARAAQTGTTRPATRAAGSHLVTFTQDELNALFDKWSIMYGWSGNYQKFVDAPTLILRDGRLIVAGKVKDLGSIVSIHLRPHLDENGRLRLELVKVRAGRLPLPDSFWTRWRDQAAASIRRHLPRWQVQSRITPSGAANTAAMSAAMGQLFLNFAAEQPAAPVLFLPLADNGDSVPVKLTGVEFHEGNLSLAVEPMTPAERAALLERVQSALK